MTITDIAEADREAEQAHQAAAAAESDLASGQRSVGFDALQRLRDRMRHADLAADGARAKAERARQEARTAALKELGERIDAMAGTAGSDLAATLAQIAELAGLAREQATAWDASVAEVAAAARDLGATGPAPGGPRSADAAVAVSHDDRVWHGRTLLQPVGGQLGAAIAHAIAGDAVSAVATIKAAVTAPEPRRSDHYLRGKGGMIVTYDDPLPPVIAAQIGSGQLAALSESEIRAFLAGEA